MEKSFDKCDKGLVLKIYKNVKNVYNDVIDK